MRTVRERGAGDVGVTGRVMTRVGRKIEYEEEATGSSFPKRENSREWGQFGYLVDGLFQVGCRSMFIHVKGWAVVRGSGWLKDSGGGRGCNKRNGYSRPARMPSPRDDQRGVFTQQRVARIIVRTPTPARRLSPLLPFPCLSLWPSRGSRVSLNLVVSQPRLFISFAVQRHGARRYFHYACRFISICRCTGGKKRVRAPGLLDILLGKSDSPNHRPRGDTLGVSGWTKIKQSVVKIAENRTYSRAENGFAAGWLSARWINGRSIILTNTVMTVVKHADVVRKGTLAATWARRVA